MVIGGGSFYAGTQSVKNSTERGPDLIQAGPGGQMRTSQNNGAGLRAKQFGEMTVGEIISKMMLVLRVRLLDGGSKIIFFSDSTTITKSVIGSSADLTMNENVIVNGSSNADGSINAQSIQIGSGMQGFRQN